MVGEQFGTQWKDLWKKLDNYYKALLLPSWAEKAGASTPRYNKPLRRNPEDIWPQVQAVLWVITNLLSFTQKPTESQGEFLQLRCYKVNQALTQ